ncbi:putative G-protein coupled receptor 148 [Discoglossus pictus]
MKLFLIPTSVCLGAAIIVTPFILFAIFANFSLRHETRFLLLGNVLVADLLYLLLYTTTTMLNVINLDIPRCVCPLLLFLLAVTYCGGVITALAMVADTFLAVLWPLHYMLLLPSSRTKKLIVILWFFSFICPAIMFLSLNFTQKTEQCQPALCSLPLILLMALHGNNAIKLFHILFICAFLICFSMILGCYVFLCYKTRESGIWKSICSRAGVTFLMHHFILCFHMCPILLLLVTSLLYINDVVRPETGLWFSLTICHILIVLPKGMSPYLYGFRYREIFNSLRLFYKLKHHGVVTPANRCA